MTADIAAAVFQSAAASLEVALAVVEPDGTGEQLIRWSNQRFSELLGVAVADVEGRPLTDFVSTSDGVPLATRLRRQRTTTTDVTLKTAAGEALDCRLVSAPAHDGDLWTLRVYQAHSEVELALRASADAHEQRFRMLAERSPVPTMMSEQGMRLAHVNDALCALLGVTADNLTGTGWLTHAHREDVGAIRDAVIDVLQGNEQEIHARFVDSHRRVRYTDIRFTPLHTPGLGDGFVATLEDITERRALEEQLTYQANHDALTGLPLRNKLWEYLAAALEARGPGVACMFLDLDNFKVVNDSLGHTAGDKLLVEVARRLTGAVRPGDMVARFGGDEFIVVCATDSLDTALGVADRIVRLLREPLMLHGVEVRPRCSIGVVLCDDSHRTPDDVIRDCDIAMYQAKSRGKGRVMVLDESARTAVYHTLTLVSDLRHAIEDRELTVAYQPIMRYRGDLPELMSVEALARWQHGDRGAVPADEFVNLAEEHGLVRDLGRLVLDVACAAMSEWQRVLGPKAPPRVNVNVSALEVNDYQLVQTVTETLRRHNLQPHQLCLEITESALMLDPEAASTILRQLRDEGVQIAIDDFGTGYSSLAYLRQLPVNYLKVDRSFVAELQDGHTAVTKAVISLAHSLSLGVVAEGVETASQMAMLEAMDCADHQGFGISRPLNDRTFMEWCQAGYPLAHQEQG